LDFVYILFQDLLFSIITLGLSSASVIALGRYCSVFSLTLP